MRKFYPVILLTDSAVIYHAGMNQLDHIVVMQRPDAKAPHGELKVLLEERLTAEPGDLHASSAGRIFLQPVTQLDISATGIRERIAIGRSARFLVPERVLAIIDHLGLYQTD